MTTSLQLFFTDIYFYLLLRKCKQREAMKKPLNTDTQTYSDEKDTNFPAH